MKKNDKIIKKIIIDGIKDLIKIIITIVILSSISLYADKNELIHKDIIKTKLVELLANIKKYKKRNKNKNKKLRQELNSLKREFEQYKIRKNREIKKIKNQLIITKKELLLNKKRKNIRKKIVRKKTTPPKIVRKKIVRKKTTPQKNVRKKIVQKKILPKKKVLREKVVMQRTTPLPIVNNLPWVEIVVENNLNIYQLALKYYGDKTKYREIYAANQHVIGKNLKIYNGMSLKIPMTNQFSEQPMILNTN